MQVQQMFSTMKTGAGANTKSLASCIEACLSCAATCNACADACLAEPQLDMLRRCIRLNLDCADLCAVTARVLGRPAEVDPSLARTLLEACARACAACGAECQKHAKMHEHCRVCAEDCARCERECQTALSALSTARS